MKLARTLGVFALSSLLMAFNLTGCADSGTGSSGGGGTVDTDGLTNYVDFDSSSVTYGTYMYSAGTAMTTPTSTVTASIVADPTSATLSDGTANKSLSLSGDLQNDKYAATGSYTLETGYRLKVADLLGSSSLGLLNKAFRIKVYIPADSINTSFQVNLQDSGFQQAMGGAVTVTPGEWNTLYYKLLPAGNTDNTKYTDRPCFVVLDSTGAVTAQGAYTGSSFDPTLITQVELRTLAGSTNNIADNIGTVVQVYVDDIGWGDLGVTTVDAATPVISAQPVGTIYGTAPVSETTYDLSVTASVSDSGTLSYQWYEDAVAISGATAATYSAPVGTSGSHSYYVVVTNTNSAVTGVKTASVTSNTVSVSVTTVTITSADTVTAGGTITLAATITPSNATGTLGWAVTNGTGTASITSGVLSALTAGTVTVTATFGSASATQTVTIAAVTASTRTITFDANGGSGTMSQQSVDEESSVTLTSNAFTYTSGTAVYTFSGWSTTKSGSVEYADGASYTGGSSDVTLYAIWSLSYVLGSLDTTYVYDNNYAGTYAITITSTADPLNASATVNMVVTTNNNALPLYTFSLPTGKTFADVKTFVYEYYADSSMTATSCRPRLYSLTSATTQANAYKSGSVFYGTSFIALVTGSWQTRTMTISGTLESDATLTVGNEPTTTLSTFELAVGPNNTSSSTQTYYIRNVRATF